MSRVLNISDLPEYIDTPEARKYFSIIKAHLEEYYAYRPIDKVLVRLAIKSLLLYDEYCQKVMEGDIIQYYDSGATNVSTSYTIMQKEEDKLKEYFKQLGIGAENRSGSKAFSKIDEIKKDPMSKVI